MAELPDMLVLRLGVGEDSGRSQAGRLASSGRLDPVPDDLGRFAAGFGAQLLVFDGRDFDMEVDPVQEGSGDMGAVPLNLGRGAGAFPDQVPVIAAGMS